MNKQLHFSDFIEDEDALGTTMDSIDNGVFTSFSQAVLWGTDWTVDTLIRQMQKNNIELEPEFQRRDAWDRTKKSRFIESLILGLPIPPIILAESQIKKGAYIVIDGKQRLLTLMQFSEIPISNPEIRALKLSTLDILGNELNDKTYEKCIHDPRFEDYIRRYENQSVRTLIIKNWPNRDFLYTVFYRLNTGSLKLSPQELRQALLPGPFIKFVNEYSMTSKGIHRIFKTEKPDSRMRDVELLVHFFAFKNYNAAYTGRLSSFLDEACSKLNEMDDLAFYKTDVESFEDAVDFVFQVFGDDAFTKFDKNKSMYTGRFNKPLFDLLSIYFADRETRVICEQKKEAIKTAFETVLCNDQQFIDSISVSTKDVTQTRYRQMKWAEVIDEIVKQ